MIIWHSHLEDPTALLGIIPIFFDEDDPRPAREQVAERYVGGWHPSPGFTLDDESLFLLYEGDPPLCPAAACRLRDEIIIVYPHAWVAIIHKNGSFEVARCD